ncbi:MAG: RNA polymerase sigma factor region1.1 domain-containing protein, partial [Kiloniellaceae bacterium]
MASKASEGAVESTETREESADGPLMDGMSATVKKMVQKAKERGYVTYDELNQVLPPDQMSSEQIEDTMAMLSEMGITLIESEEQEDGAGEEEEEKSAAAAGNLADDDIGRTDDPVRMYLREMGSVELLSREGEIAIAKRIEAGREKMIGGICESPLTIKALLFWRQSLIEGRILLRDIIDLDATYGAGPNDDDIAKEESGEADSELEEALAKEAAKQMDPSEPPTARPQTAEDGAAEGDEDEEEESNISLAAMEAALLPSVLATFDEIATTYKRLSRAQDKRLTALQRGQKVSPQSERHYERVKAQLIELMEDVHFNNARIEQLVEQLYDLNKRLVGLDGKLMRLAEKH